MNKRVVDGDGLFSTKLITALWLSQIHLSSVEEIDYIFAFMIHYCPQYALHTRDL